MSLADRLAKSQQKDRMSEVRVKVQERLVEVLGPRLYDSTLSDNELEGLVHQRLRELLDEEEGPLSAQEKLLIVRQIGDSVLGLGPLEPYKQYVNVYQGFKYPTAGGPHFDAVNFLTDSNDIDRSQRCGHAGTPISLGTDVNCPSSTSSRRANPAASC